MLSSWRDTQGGTRNGPENHRSLRPLHPRRHEPPRLPRPPDQAGGLGRRRHGAAAAAAERLRAGRDRRGRTTPRLATERVTFDSPKGKINGYLARPKAKGKRPAVLVIHENRGLNPHLEDVARRFAVEGFLAYAVDLLSLVGGTPANEDAARELHPKMNQDDAVAALVAAVSFLKKHAGIDRQGRRGRLLLRRPDGQPAGGVEPGARCRRRLLRPAGAGRRRCRTSRRRCCCTTRRTTTA